LLISNSISGAVLPFDVVCAGSPAIIKSKNKQKENSRILHWDQKNFLKSFEMNLKSFETEIPVNIAMSDIFMV